MEGNLDPGDDLSQGFWDEMEVSCSGYVLQGGLSRRNKWRWAKMSLGESRCGRVSMDQEDKVDVAAGMGISEIIGLAGRWAVEWHIYIWGKQK